MAGWRRWTWCMRSRRPARWTPCRLTAGERLQCTFRQMSSGPVQMGRSARQCFIGEKLSIRASATRVKCCHMPNCQALIKCWLWRKYDTCWARFGHLPPSLQLISSGPLIYRCKSVMPHCMDACMARMQKGRNWTDPMIPPDEVGHYPGHRALLAKQVGKNIGILLNH
jgi:hypothetical protein